MLCIFQRIAYKSWKQGEATDAQPDRMALLEAAGFDTLYADIDAEFARNEDNAACNKE